MEGQWRRGPMIGCGSSAAVYLATASGRSSGKGVVFAVKSKELSKAGDLFTEQRILSGLESRSPHIVSYLGFEISAADEETTNGSVYNLFLEYATGGSLSDEIKRNGGWLSEGKIRARASEILRGLAYLHERGVVHCDIKSQNVLIGSDGCAKIADFGCAKNAFSSKKEPVRGTPIFMAPEVARGEEQGMPADIWALGCTVVEMATGGSPWDGAFSDPISAMHRIGFSDEVPTVPNWMSEDAKDFLSKCLQRNWRERLSAKELLKHPFIAASSVSKPSIIRENYWVSPTSNLDQGFWDSFLSLEEDDDAQQEQEEEQTEPNVSERIKALIGGFTGEPDWICDDDDDENWVTVRCNGIEEKIDEAEEEFSSSCSSIVANDIHELFSESEESLLEVSFVSERSILVGSLDNHEISLCENDEISVCNNGDFGFGFGNFKHEIVDCVLKQEIQAVKTLSGFVKVFCCFLLINLVIIFLGIFKLSKLEIQAKQATSLINCLFKKNRFFKIKGSTWPTRSQVYLFNLLYRKL